MNPSSRPSRFSPPTSHVHVFRQRQKALDLHHHAWDELVIVTKGEGSHERVDATGSHDSFRVTRGDIFIIRKGQSHAYLDPCDMEIFNVLHTPVDTWLPTHHLEQTTGLHALFRLAPSTCRDIGLRPVLSLSPADTERAEAHCEAMLAEQHSRNADHQFAVTAHFMLLVDLLARRYDDQAPSGPRRTLASFVHPFAELLASMHRDFASPHTVRDLARRVHMSEPTFNRRFRQLTGQSPSAYLLALRLEHAKRLLESTDRPITDIAYASGFSDSNYFARQFRAKLGTTPGNYRRAARLSRTW